MSSSAEAAREPRRRRVRPRHTRNRIAPRTHARRGGTPPGAIPPQHVSPDTRSLRRMPALVEALFEEATWQESSGTAPTSPPPDQGRGDRQGLGGGRAELQEGPELQEKSVPAPDQDVITMSVEAARNALARAGIDPQDDRRASTSARSPIPTRSSRPARCWPRRSARSRSATARTSSSPARPAPRRCSWPRAGQGGRHQVRPRRSAPTPRRAPPATRSSTPRRPARRPSSSARTNLVAERRLHTYSLHDGHARLLAPRVPALPAARRPLHRRARLLQAHVGARHGS